MRMLTDHLADAVGELVAFGTHFPGRFHSARHCGRDSCLPQFRAGRRLDGMKQTADPTTLGPVIVLVEPQLGENIGMVARAMANFGLTELRLVAPRDGWPSDKA